MMFYTFSLNLKLNVYYLHFKTGIEELIKCIKLSIRIISIRVGRFRVGVWWWLTDRFWAVFP